MRLELDDLLLLAGCACIVAGVALWSIPAGLIALGMALIGFGVLIGRKKADDGVAE